VKINVELAILATFSCRQRVSSSLAAYGTLYKSQSLTQKKGLIDYRNQEEKFKRNALNVDTLKLSRYFLSCRLYFEEFFVYLVDDLGV
jgi:hypothetical protein